MQKLLIILFLIFGSTLTAEIIETTSFAQLENYLTEDSIVLLDIDDTLLIPQQMLGCDLWFQERWEYHYKQGLTKRESLERALAEWEGVRHLTQMEIVEPRTAEIVASLQMRHTVIGLTTQGLALATRTQQQLAAVSIDLIRSAPSKEDYYQVIDNEGVLYRNGTLFTAGTNKGKALFGLLEHIGLTPKRIVFINDKTTHLRAVEVVAEERGVEFIGLRYGYSDARKTRYCKKIADYQFNNSTFTHILSDEEASKKLHLK